MWNSNKVPNPFGDDLWQKFKVNVYGQNLHHLDELEQFAMEEWVKISEDMLLCWTEMFHNINY